jgi:hypothetical protein
LVKKEGAVYIAIENHSTLISNTDAMTMTWVVASQMRYHAAPVWGRSPAAVIFHAAGTPVPPGAHVIGIFDDSDQQGALGWHTEDAGDAIYGRVFARPVLTNGGDALTKTLSVASVLSHEVLEMWADPGCQAWMDDNQGHLHALEVCDPVESDSYLLKGVTVSNFVYPAWFDPHATPTDPVDYLHTTHAPFTLAPGGYEVYRDDAGQEQTRFGDEVQAWRHDTKLTPLSRTWKRLGHAPTPADVKNDPTYD